MKHHVDTEALAEWFLSGTTGASATCIAAHLTGRDSDGSYPHDSGDFGRCERLMDMVPGIRARLPEMASVNQYWAALVPKWDDVRRAENKGAAIRAIIDPLHDADTSVIRFSGGAIMRFGRPK